MMPVGIEVGGEGRTSNRSEDELRSVLLELAVEEGVRSLIERMESEVLIRQSWHNETQVDRD